MRFWTSAAVLGLGALAASPCLALTFQAAPPRPDVAQHLRSTTSTTAQRMLPAPDQLKDSFLASGRSQLGQGFYAPAGERTTSFSFGPLHGTTTVTPGYGAAWDGASPRDRGNPLALTPPRP